MVIPWSATRSPSCSKRQAHRQGRVRRVPHPGRPGQMPGLRSGVLDWPYVEGLRIDEAMHPLALLAFGMYGEVLPNQNGAPLRLALPGSTASSRSSPSSRSASSKQPRSSWEKAAPRRVRFLFQRQPDGGPPALEPGHRAPHWPESSSGFRRRWQSAARH